MSRYRKRAAGAAAAEEDFHDLLRRGTLGTWHSQYWDGEGDWDVGYRERAKELLEAHHVKI